MKILLKDSDLFFQSEKPGLKRDFIQVLFLSAVFSVLTVFTIEAGWTSVKDIGLIEEFAGIFAAVILGILILTSVLSLLIFKKINKTMFGKALFIISYASTPVMVFGWIPHGLVKLIAIIWSLLFVKVGIETSLNRTEKQSIMVSIGLAIILIIIIAITQIYLISPL